MEEKQLNSSGQELSVNKPKLGMWILIILGVIVLIGIIIGAYFLVSGEETSSEEREGTIDLENSTVNEPINSSESDFEDDPTGLL